MTQDDLAQTLGVSIDALKSWRSAKYRYHRLKLLPIPGTTPSRYSNEAIVEWLKRNPSYKDKVLASLVDTTPTPAQPAPALAGLFGIPSHQPTPTESAPA